MSLASILALAFLGFVAHAQPPTCPPSIAQCGLGTVPVTNVVNGCAVHTCEARVAVEPAPVPDPAPGGGGAQKQFGGQSCSPRFGQEHPDCSSRETLLWNEQSCAFECVSDANLCRPKGEPSGECAFQWFWDVKGCGWTCVDDPFCPGYICSGKWRRCPDGNLSHWDAGRKIWSCEADGDGREEKLQRLNALEKEVRELCGADLSCATASDCESVPMGHKPCGGPAFFVPTSKHNAKLSLIQRRAREHAEGWAAYQEEFMPGMGSTCDLVPPRELECREHRCVERDDEGLRAYPR